MYIGAGSSFAQACSANFYSYVDSLDSCKIHFVSTSTGTSSLTNYYWTFGNGSSASGSSTSHQYSSSGWYNVTLNIYDSSGCNSRYTDSIYVRGCQVTPACSASFYYYVDSLDSCKVHFVSNSTGTNSGTSYGWSFGDGTYGSGSSTTKQYSSSGSYTVKLTIYDSQGCSSTVSRRIYATGCGSSNPCSADFSYYRDSIDSCKIYFYSTSTGVTSGTSYSWTFGDGSSSMGSSTSHQYATTGWYGVTLTIADSSRCSSSNMDTLFVVGCSSSNPCTASFYSYIDSLDSCKIHFVSNSTGITSGTSFSWSFGDGNSSSGSSTSHQYSSNGWYFVTLTISDSANNCYATYSDSVYANGCGKGSKCRSSISGQVSTGTSMAQSATVYLIEKRGNNLFAIDTTYVDSLGYYFFGRVCSGSYYVKAALRSSDPNYTDYLPTYYGDELRWNNATVVAVTTAKMGVDIKMIRGTNPGGPGFVRGNVKKGANKKAGEALEDVQIMVLNDQYEAVAYTYSDEEGVFDISGLEFGQYVLLADIPGLKSGEFWFTLSKGEEGVEDVVIEVNENDIATSINRTLVDWSSSLTLYPNPVENYVVISVGDGFEGTAMVYDLTGSLQLNTVITQNSQIDLAALPSGAYVLKVSGSANNQGVVAQRMLIKN